MRISIELGEENDRERTVDMRILAKELLRVHLHVADPERRNRSCFYMRRHTMKSEAGSTAPYLVSPNDPIRSPLEPPKLTIPAHINAMRRSRLIPESQSSEETREPVLIAVPISDLAANLLRPCFHRDGLGTRRLFYFEGEPIESRTYWCACFFESAEAGGNRFELREIRFDPQSDRALEPSGGDLSDKGLVWAAAVVPLIISGRPLSVVEIAQNNYDLRQIVGRDFEDVIRYAYDGWYENWDQRVEQIVFQHLKRKDEVAIFYHSILGFDAHGSVCIWQTEGALPDLAERFAKRGIVAAGLLDSGGSCALYDVWMASYLNHGWYFREPRGAILVFELATSQRIPRETPDSWVHRKRTVEACGR